MAQYRSHLGVYALIYNDKTDHVLLIKKSLGCYTGLYDLPGGSMEPKELLEETLYREVFEETSCTITKSSQLGTFSVLYPHMQDNQPHILRHLGVIYTATVTGTPRATGDGTDDSDGCVWLPPHALDKNNATPFVLMALDAVRKAKAA